MIGAADIEAFLADPLALAEGSLTGLYAIPRQTLAELHRLGLSRRFAALRPAVPLLDRLAANRGVDGIEAIDDALPLLFDHATYKSYPKMLLEKHRYAQLTAWLDKLTAHDLTSVDVSACRSVDDWIATLARETPLAICHTSGTGGTLSFLPWSHTDWRRAYGAMPLLFFQTFGEDGTTPREPIGVPCIYPYFRSGGLSHMRVNDVVVDLIAGCEENFHAAYPGRLSADLLLLGARLRQAAARGEAVALDPDMEERRAEFEAMQREMPEHLARFFAATRTELAGRRVFLMATGNLLHTMADAGLKQGIRGVFARDSIVVSGGGGKGVELPPDWQDKVATYLGVDRIRLCYGMSEMSGLCPACEHGHYHLPPWIVPFALDPDSGEALPREGEQRGQFAFYDLLPETRWGGFRSGDEVTLGWEPCPCGRTTAWIGADVQRLSARGKDGADDEKISCAAAADSYEDALDYLSEVAA